MKPKAAKAKTAADVHHGARPGGHKKVFDVTRPGKTPAAATSRPVIVGHKKIQHDINGISAPKEKEIVNDQNLLDARHKVTVQPAGALNTKVAVTAKAPVSSQASAAPVTPMPAPLSEVVTSPPPVPAPAHTLTREEEIIDLGELALGIDPPPLTQEASTPTAPPSDVLLAAAARDLDKTVGDSAAPHMPQTIIVSHHHPRMEWGKFMFILLVVAVLGLAVFNFLLDLNILDENSPLPHTDFFQR
jgi:hypothetical protein